MPNRIADELISQLYDVWPVLVRLISLRSVDIVSVIFAGHLGSHQLAAVGFATVFAQVTGYSLLNGFTDGVVFFTSQRFSSLDSFNLGIVLQRTVLVITCCVLLPVSLIWLLGGRILVAFGQDYDLAQNIWGYLLLLLPGLWAYGFSCSLQNWLTAQSYNRPCAVIEGLSAILHPVVCYLFVYRFGLEFYGLALAISTCRILQLIAVGLYGASLLKDSEFRFSMQSWSEWPALIQMGLSHFVSLVDSWNTVMLLVIFVLAGVSSGELDEIAALAVFFTTLSLCCVVPFSFEVVGSNRVQQELSKNLATDARMCALICVGTTVVVSACLSLLLFLTSSYWPYIFTTESTIHSSLSRIAPELCLSLILNGTLAVMSGVTRLLCRRGCLDSLAGVSYYGVGVPLGACLGFGIFGGNSVKGIVGLTLGAVLGAIVSVLVLFVVLWRVDWQFESDFVQVVNRVQVLSQHIHSSGHKVGDFASRNPAAEGDEDLRASYFELRHMQQTQLNMLHEKSRHNRYDNDEWWDVLSSSDTETADPRRDSALSSSGLSLRSFVRYIRMQTRALFRIKEPVSEYELVQAYTDSLASDEWDGIESDMD